MSRARGSGRTWSLVGVWAMGVGGCHVHAVSPPVAALDLETAATSGEGHVAVAGSGGLREGWRGGGGGGSLASVSGRVSYGATDRLDLRVGATRHEFRYLSVPVTRPVRRDVLAGWAGAKIGLIARRRRAPPMVALETSVGGGRWELGGYLGADSGVVFSFENPYVVPFVGGGFGVSVPVHATALPLDRSRLDDNDSVGRLEPRTTYTFSMTAGAKLLLPTGERDALGRTQGGIAILLGFGYLRLWDDLEYYAFLSGTVGFEVTFPSLTPRRSPPTF